MADDNESTSVPRRLPPDAIMLTADDAVCAIRTGDHPEAGKESSDFDDWIIQMIQSGQMVAARLPDGRLALGQPED